MGIVVLAGWMVLAGWAVGGTGLTGWRGTTAKSVLAMILLIMGSATTALPLRLAADGPTPASGDRAAVRQFTQRAVRLTPPTSRIYVLSFGTKGLTGYIARYELAPRRTNTSCFDVGSRRFEGDVWTCPMSVEDLRTTLQSYDYVVLGTVDATFWEEFGELFGGRAEGSLFEVMKDGPVTLAAR
jgi:hypothetical protein